MKRIQKQLSSVVFEAAEEKTSEAVNIEIKKEKNNFQIIMKLQNTFFFLFFF